MRHDIGARILDFRHGTLPVRINGLGPALASLFWVSVDFPELFLKTSELFLKSLGPVEKAKSYS